MALLRRGGLQVPTYNTRGAKLRREKEDWISRIPDEVLQQIFLEDVLDIQDLQSVALVSRRFSILVRVSLYSHITIVPRGNLYKRFKRLLKKHPELAFCVWRATLLPGRLGKFDGRLSDKPYALARNEFVKLLPALRSLELGPYLCSTELLGLFEHPTSQLRHISFDCGTDRKSILKAGMAMSLPRIKKLSLKFSSNYPSTPDMVFQDMVTLECPFSTSSLKELALVGQSYSMEFVILKSDLLRIPRALEKFSCKYDRGHERSRFSMSRQDMIIKALRPLYSTLISLDLHFIGARVGLRYESVVADLSCFVCLKSLYVDDSLVFPTRPWGLFDESCGLYNQLPYTLETLKIYFNGDNTYREESGTEPPRAPYGWLLELVEYKSVKFPNLEEILLVSDESTLSQFSNWEYWKDSVLDVFENAGISLLVSRIARENSFPVLGLEFVGYYGI